MKLFMEPKNVDFSTKSSPMTKEEHKEVSEFIRKSKAARSANGKQKRVRKNTTPALTSKS